MPLKGANGYISYGVGLSAHADEASLAKVVPSGHWHTSNQPFLGKVAGGSPQPPAAPNGPVPPGPRRHPARAGGSCRLVALPAVLLDRRVLVPSAQARLPAQPWLCWRSWAARRSRQLSLAHPLVGSGHTIPVAGLGARVHVGRSPAPPHDAATP